MTRTPTSFDSAGLCTWAVHVSAELGYVADPSSGDLTIDLGKAHVWLDEGRAKMFAQERAPHGATAVRAR